MPSYSPVLLLVVLACPTMKAGSIAINATDLAEDGTTGWVDLCALGCCGDGMVDVTYDADLAPTVGLARQYKFVTLYGVWDYMHELCAIYGGHMVRIESMRENNCLAKYILDKVDATGTAWWAIGLKQLKDETMTPVKTYNGLFEWADAVNVDNTLLPDITTSSFTNWATNYPRTGNYPAGVMQVGPAIASGKWYNYDDHSTAMHAICEKEMAEE